jgi:hypothetical protein
MAMPMNSEARKPSANRMITTTSSTLMMTEFWRSLSIVRMTFDLSCVKATLIVPGQVFCSRSTTFFTPSTVSIRLAPVRFETSMVIAGLPLTRVMVVASLKVGLTCATSPSVTVAPRDDAIGMLNTSCGRSISDGTLTANRPVSPSSAPAATRLLEAVVTAIN